MLYVSSYLSGVNVEYTTDVAKCNVQVLKLHIYILFLY